MGLMNQLITAAHHIVPIVIFNMLRCVCFSKSLCNKHVNRLLKREKHKQKMGLIPSGDLTFPLCTEVCGDRCEWPRLYAQVFRCGSPLLQVPHGRLRWFEGPVRSQRAIARAAVKLRNSPVDWGGNW